MGQSHLSLPHSKVTFLILTSVFSHFVIVLPYIHSSSRVSLQLLDPDRSNCRCHHRRSASILRSKRTKLKCNAQESQFTLLQTIFSKYLEPKSQSIATIATMLEDNDQIESEKPSRLLSERVNMTVNNIRRRMTIFRKYARDIKGKTGLGAIAALQYVESVIRNRESVWGDLVMIVMQSKPAQVQDIVLSTARDILEAPIDERQWTWFRDNLLSTFVWFSPSVSRPGSYLYEQLLEIASTNIAIQARLVNDKRFPLLEGIPSATYLLCSGDGECRQDDRRVGLLPDICEQTLSTDENKQFYDLNVYLNKLICVARLLDPAFQAHLSCLFAQLQPPPHFQPGPPKSLARCRAKAQVEYGDCAWPTTAHLLDIVRCSLTFRTQEDLLAGFTHLQNAAAAAAAAAGGAAEPSGPSIEIARVKNGFRPGKTGYRDLKVTVIFRPGPGSGPGSGPRPAMAGEVALVLEELLEYRRATHELYEILRERDFFDQVVAALRGFL